ncbi:MAG: hypothetical protein ABIP30_06820 [Ferruginibacter sp.]
MNLNICFSGETLFKLTNYQFEVLKSSGEYISDFAPSKDYSIAEDEYARLFLVYNSEASNFSFEFDPEDDIDQFINNSTLVNFYPKTGKLEVIPSLNKTLKEILPALCEEKEMTKVISKKLADIESVLHDEILSEKAEVLLASGNFKDQVCCCSCGVSGCSSEYLWAQNFYVLAKFLVSESELAEICIYPFKFINNIVSL